MVEKRELRQWIGSAKSMAFAIAIHFYYILKRILLPVVLRYPDYFRIPLLLKSAVLGWLSGKVEQGEGGLGVEPLLATPLSSVLIKGRAPVRTQLPQWLVHEWEEMHQIEPMLIPSPDYIESLFFYTVPNSRLVQPYIELGDAFGEDVTHVFLLPRLSREDTRAGTAAFCYADVLQKQCGGRIVIIATGPEKSELTSQLPGGIRFIDFGKKYGYLSPDEQEKLLARLLLQTAPEVIHLMESKLGYDLVVKYGEALKTVSNIYASVFAGDRTAKGVRSGFSYGVVPRCFDSLKALVSDSKTHLEDLCSVFAFEREKLILHDIPRSDVAGAFFPDHDASGTFLKQLVNTPGYTAAPKPKQR